MTPVQNDDAVVSLLHENTIVSLQGTYKVHLEIDFADKVGPENSQAQVPRRSTRERRSTITNDYIVYLQEYEFDTGLEDDPTSLNEVKLNIHFTK